MNTLAFFSFISSTLHKLTTPVPRRQHPPPLPPTTPTHAPGAGMVPHHPSNLHRAAAPQRNPRAHPPNRAARPRLRVVREASAGRAAQARRPLRERRARDPSCRRSVGRLGSILRESGRQVRARVRGLGRLWE